MEHLCGRCNGKITKPESIERGYGPVCYRIMEKEREQEQNAKNDTVQEEGINFIDELNERSS